MFPDSSLPAQRFAARPGACASMDFEDRKTKLDRPEKLGSGSVEKDMKWLASTEWKNCCQEGTSELAFDNYVVRIVEDSDPELFFLAWSTERPGPVFLRTIQRRTEIEMRAELGRRGVSETRTDSLIRQARGNSE
jgi:hypothetical protein